MSAARYLIPSFVPFSPYLVASSARGPQLGARRHFAGGHITPERDQQLARQSHDHCFANIARSTCGSSTEPLGQRAFLLEHEPAPCQLHPAPPYPGITCTCQSLLSPFAPPFVPPARHTRAAPTRSFLAQIS